MTTLVAFALAVSMLGDDPGKTKDDGFGRCAAFSHYHMTVGELLAATGDGKSGVAPADDDKEKIRLDGLCHRDDNDEPIEKRQKLPKPEFHPDPSDTWL